MGLTTLEQRRIRGDLIEAFKILKGIDRIDSVKFFEVVSMEHNTRGHSMKLFLKRSRLNVRKNFFSNRVVKYWNDLPQIVVDAGSVNQFKNRLDRHWQDTGV